MPPLVRDQRLLPRMNLQQAVHVRSANGFVRRKVERDMGTRLDNKLQSGKSNPSKSIHAAAGTVKKGVGYESPLCDRLVYLTTCLLGHHVEVQVKNGSIYSGIFHAANAEKDFGIILKMARLVKDGSLRGQKSIADSVSKAPSKILIIPGKELIQVIAKGASITRDEMKSEFQREKQQEMVVDSVISQSRHAEVERELERWVPDEDIPQCPELENIFDGHWNRSWDQFETNEALFGVKSTFDEELYTTKLERGPQMRELEREAMRIAREIEGEDTQDLHLAEERGIHLNEDFDIDEETKFSSVFRGVDDSGYEEDEEIVVDVRNSETFGGPSSCNSQSFSDLIGGNSKDEACLSSCTSSLDELQSSQSDPGRNLYNSGSNDQAKELPTELSHKGIQALDDQSRVQDNQSTELHLRKDTPPECVELKETFTEEAQTSKREDTKSTLDTKADGPDRVGLSPNATSYDPPSRTSSKPCSPIELSVDASSGKLNGTTTSLTSDNVGNAAVSSSRRPGLSPSSSVGSFSSEKSTLNPHAKEFKLNPNAKSFVPSSMPLRPQSPVSDGSYYYPTNVSGVPAMHGMPVGIGIGPSFAGPQPVLFNPQAAAMQPPQAYFPPNGPQYGQQMIVGHPRPFMYMPSYTPEMPYKGRDF